MFKIFRGGKEDAATVREETIKKYREKIDFWSLDEIRNLVAVKQPHEGVPYSDEAMAAILDHFLNHIRPDGTHEIDHKGVFPKSGQKYIGERTKKILQIIYKIGQSSVITSKTAELILEIMNFYKDEQGNPEYKEELTKVYEKAMKTLAKKAEIQARLRARYGG